MPKLANGDKAPDFTLLDQNEKEVSLKDYKGKKLLIYFYPKANTPGCTKQSCNIRDAMQDFKKLGIAAIGISPDAPDKQKKFDEKYSLGYPLLSDLGHNVAQTYGAYGEKNMYGKKVMGIIRSSFLIDEKGNIIEAWYKVKPDDTVPKALEALERITASKKNI